MRNHPFPTHFADGPDGIWLRQTFPESGRIELQNPPVFHDEPEVPLDLVANTMPSHKVSVRIVTLQPDQVEMTHNRRLQSLQHFILQIKVILKQPFVCPAGDEASLSVHLMAIVDRDRVDVMDGSHEELEWISMQQVIHKRQRRRTNPINLHADQDLNVGRVRRLQAPRFLNVRLERGGQVRLGRRRRDLYRER